MKKYFYWAALILLFASCKKDNKTHEVKLQDGLEYTFTVKIKSYWNAENHPTDFPTNAGFGKILGFSHHSDNLLFTAGNTAPNWLKSYFSSDNVSDFNDTFKEYKEVNKIYSIISEKGFTATETKEFTFKADSYNHKLSLVCKLSPSPDWFIGVSNIDLNRIAYKGFHLFYIPNVLDAGLYSGKTYIEKGESTNAAITYKTDSPLQYPKGGVNKLCTIEIINTGSVKKN